MRTIGSAVSRRGSTTSAMVIISVVDAGISSIPAVSRNARIGDASPGWTHDAPRSTGTPASVTVWVRPPMRSRPSSTVTGTPARCSARAATRPDTPAPMTTTDSTAPSAGVGIVCCRSSTSTAAT